MKLIKRPFYLENLINVKDIPDIKIITGVRRSGKSKLLDAFYDYLINDKDNKSRMLQFSNFPISYWKSIIEDGDATDKSPEQIKTGI